MIGLLFSETYIILIPCDYPQYDKIRGESPGSGQFAYDGLYRGRRR
jgi:hypothetical protein